MNKGTETKKERLRGPIAWMAGHSVAANLLMAVFLIGGFFWAMQIKQEVFGEFTLEWVTVNVAYPGASPEEVEQAIVLVIEEEVQALDNVKEIRASAKEGSGSVTVEMLKGGDLDKLSQDVQKAIDRIKTFPQEAEEPQISVMSRRRQVLSIILYGDPGEWILREKAEEIRRRLLDDPDIIQVDLSSVRDYEMTIEVPQENLRAYNLTLNDVARQVRMATVELPGGSLKTEGGEILVRMMEGRDYGREFAQIPIITSMEGTELRLEDIAIIKDGFVDTDHYATYNGKRAVKIDVYRVGNQTPITVSDAVLRHVEELKKAMPPGMDLEVLNNMADIFGQRLDLLTRNAYLGLLLVFALLALFLEPRLAFWVTMGIPISFLGSFLFLDQLGISLNMNSMFAFIVALGIVVDDAIVVGENIYKFRSQGYSFLTAAVKGAREVAMPVTFAILTNIVTFTPLLFIPGPLGRMFFAIPVVVIIVIAISLIESLFVLPAHIGHLKDRGPWGPMKLLFSFQQKFSFWFARMIRKIYGPVVALALRYRYVTIVIGVSVMVLTLSVVASRRLGLTMIEKVESDFAQVTATLTYGTAVAKTEAVRDRLMKAAEKVAKENGGDNLLKGIYAEIGVIAEFIGGTSAGHTTRLRVYLTGPEVRPIPTDEFVDKWREEAGEIPGLESLNFKSDAGGPGSQPALNIELTHKDMEVLDAAGAELASAISAYPMASDIDDGFQPGKPQIDFAIRPEGRALGLTTQEIANQVRHSFYGAEVLRQQRGRNEVKIMVRLPEAERASEFNLEELILRTPAGKDVPLREVVDIKRGRAYTSIERKNGQRLISVTAEIKPRPLANMVSGSLKESTLPGLVERYPGLSYGAGGMEKDLNESMMSLAMGLGMAMLVIYTLLAIPFRSYIQPFIIMSSIPFGIVGAILGHMIMGYSLSLMSLFGIVALTGVVVNDSLVFINFANRERARGLSVYKALISAGILRFRPIMLTSLTTFGALVPMIFETSRQARFMIPMAISLGFGVLFATGITLILVPSLYMIIEDIRGLLSTSDKNPLHVRQPVAEVFDK